jgi:L-threonylcarbamoyladenylate synthase
VHERLMAHEPPLPVTLLLPASDAAPAGLAGPGGLVGVRHTADPFCRAVVAAAGVPLLSTSANPAGGPPPARFEDVDAGLRARVDLAVDAGHALAGVPSTVVRIDGGRVVVVRAGAVGADVLARIVAG